MWDSDVEQLYGLAGCICCCAEHTFESCPARLWDGCRSGGATPQTDREEWAEHYRRFHGMSREEFFS